MWPFASRKDVHEETTQLRSEFTEALKTMQQILTTEIRQRSAIFPVSSDTIQLSGRLFDLELQVKELVQIVQQLSATTASGTTKPIHETIQARINQALAAINALGNEHANWLEQHRLTHDEIGSMIDQLQQKHQASAHHVFPPPEDQKDAKPVTQV
jgi:hypothetical protein